MVKKAIITSMKSEINKMNERQNSSCGPLSCLSAPHESFLFFYREGP